MQTTASSTAVLNPAAPDSADDLSALAWVAGELQKSLESAHKSLRRYLRDAQAVGNSDVDVADPTALRSARVQLHQGVGALELVGLAVPAKVLRASEAAVQRMVGKPAIVDMASVATIEAASFAVIDYLARVLGRRPVSSVALFPQYRAVQTLAGGDRVHPADLWSTSWRWHELPEDSSVGPRRADDKARGTMESLVLSLMRSPDRSVASRMSDFCAELGEGARATMAATTWRLAAAFFDAQANGLLDGDLYAKRMASRLLAQLRANVRNEDEASERLASDLLFFCARARTGPGSEGLAPRLHAVRAAWQLGKDTDVDYDTPRLGRFDPTLIAQARKRATAAKDVWSAVAGGDMRRLPGLVEPFSLLGDSIERLFPAGEVLAQSLKEAVASTAVSLTAPPASLAMEVATAVLYLDAAIDEGEFDDPQLPARMHRLAERVDDARGGGTAQPLEAWTEELYRRVADHQTMGSVVQELRASLSEVEKQIDQYFRSPSQREVLIPVPGQLSAMRGVLSVLGMEQASQAVLHMRDAVDELSATEADPERAAQTGSFDRLADNLGALGFLIDMLSVQPQLAKTLFRFDPESGRLSAVMGQTPRASVFAGLGVDGAAPLEPLADQAQTIARAAVQADVPDEDIARQLEQLSQRAAAADQSALARVASQAQFALYRATDDQAKQAARAELAQAVGDLVAPMPAMEPMRPSAPIPESRPVAPGQTGLEEDAEMREIFLEEAREVIASARDAMARLQGHPEDVGDMTIVRRAFHTLKGSARMVGMRDFGDAAWAGEQLYNARMVEDPRVDSALRDFTHDALNYLADWTEAIAASQLSGHASPVIVRAADALRHGGRASHFGASPAGVGAAVDDAAQDALHGVKEAPLAALHLVLPDLPTAADLDLSLPPLPIEEPPQELPAATAPGSWSAEPAEALHFDLDLNELEPLSEGLSPMQALPAAELIAQGPEPIELDFAAFEEASLPTSPVQPLAGPDEAEEQVKVIGPLRIGIPLFNIYLNEADEQSRRLVTELAEWALETQTRPVSEAAVALAHSLAGNSATVGYAELSALARSLEHALMRSLAAGAGRQGEAELFSEAADEIRRLLHQFAAGFLKPVPPELMERLAEHERWPAAAQAGLGGAGLRDSMPDAMLADDGPDAVDELDPELLPIFEEEAQELLPQLQSRMRDWVGSPADRTAAEACMRTLHTFKGGARLAGAMRVGEMAHQLETSIENLLSREQVSRADLEPLQAQVDSISTAFEALRQLEPAAPKAPAMTPVITPVMTPTPAPPEAVPLAQPAPASPARLPEPSPAAPSLFQALPEKLSEAPSEAPPEPVFTPAVEPAAPAPEPALLRSINWSRFKLAPVAQAVAAVAPSQGQGLVRVRAALLDRLVNEAGEVSITRARIESDVRHLQSSLNDLTESLDRMRRELREIEVQAESQISSRIEAAKAAAQAFDPLEMDRFTRLQELTRMMAESVNDVATLQRGLQRTLQSTEDQLAAQSRLTRELQDNLLRTRMVDFDTMADRFYRVVRQAAKDTTKQVRLDIVGGAIEVDRGVLERMTGPFEHLLRNSVVHGIELPDKRAAAGKDRVGSIIVTVAHEGNEVAVQFSDDGAGLDLQRIRERGVERGLLAADAGPTDAELADLIFVPGFTTASAVTELAGRGVGMDVVRAEVTAMGGRIETTNRPGQGSSFRLVLPLTTAVTQVVMLRCGALRAAVPSTLVEVVRRVPSAEVLQAYARGQLSVGEAVVPFFWMASLLQGEGHGVPDGRTQPVVVIRSASQRVAMHVDEVVGNQEVVVKHLGPQLSRMPGLAGVTLLPSGGVALIYNPVALAALYGEQARARAAAAVALIDLPPALADTDPLPPLVMVVDDSLTVRRVTQRLLEREGYRVVLAKDGVDALERLAEELPAVMLCDIEMPRMDGFDLVRTLRADAGRAALPVVMITSRIAQKHRDHAAELGVEHYLGKPFSEDKLLALVAMYAQRSLSVAGAA